MTRGQMGEASIAMGPGKLPMKAGETLRPQGWDRIRGLVCGFGGRTTGQPPSTATTVEQVHGARVIIADQLAPGPSSERADGLVVTTPGRSAAIRTADCVPILLVADSGSASCHWAAVVHAGWRGTVAGIAAVAVDQAAAAGYEPASLRAALGPAIGPCCYEVGEEVARRFQERSLPVVERTGKPHVDLRAVNETVLLRRGLRPERIQVCGPCTRCRSDLYHSYRAHPSQSGRQLSWVGWADRSV